MAYKNIWEGLNSGIIKYDLAYETERPDIYSQEVRVRFRLRSYLKSSTSTFGYNLYLKQLWLNGGVLAQDSLIKDNSPNKFDIYTYYPSETGWYTFNTKNKYVPGLRLILESKNNSPSGDYDTTTDIDISVPSYTEPIASITSAPDFNDEENPTITYSNPAGTEVSSLQACISIDGSKADVPYRDISKTGSSYTFELTDSERTILRKATTSDRINVIFFIKTVINGQTYYSQMPKSMTLINANPTFNNWSYKDTNEKILALTGNNQIVVKNYSKIVGTITAANKAIAKKNATMKKYLLLIGDNPQAEVAYSATTDVTTSPAITATEKVFMMFAQDSRDLTTSKPIFVPDESYKRYTEINIKEGTVTRKGGVGTEVTLEFNGDIWNQSFGKVQNSIVSCKYKYKKPNESNWTESTQALSPIVSGNSYSLTTTIKGDLGALGFNRDDSFDIEITITDKLSTYTYKLTLGSGKPNIAIHKNGVAFGSPYDVEEGGALQVEGKNIVNLIYPIGSIYMSVKNVNPSTYLGGTWVTWGTGKVPVGVDTSQTEFATVEKTGGEKTHRLTINEMPSHKHNLTIVGTGSTTASGVNWQSTNNTGKYANDMIDGAGGDQPHNNLQPYITCYMWKRTA